MPLYTMSIFFGGGTYGDGNDFFAMIQNSKRVYEGEEVPGLCVNAGICDVRRSKVQSINTTY